MVQEQRQHCPGLMPPAHLNSCSAELLMIVFKPSEFFHFYDSINTPANTVIWETPFIRTLQIALLTQCN